MTIRGLGLSFFFAHFSPPPNSTKHIPKMVREEMRGLQTFMADIRSCKSWRDVESGVEIEEEAFAVSLPLHHQRR